jgi:hypothetical protein
VRDERIKDGLRNKISRERVGVEVDKMLKGRSLLQHPLITSHADALRAGPKPLYALQLIHNLGLYETIFTPPPGLLSSLPSDPSSVSLDTGRLLSVLVPAPSEAPLDSIHASAPIKPRPPPLPLPNLPPLPMSIHPSLTEHVERDAQARRHLWMAACLKAYKGVKIKDKKQREIESVEHVVLESLKVPCSTTILLRALRR